MTKARHKRFLWKNKAIQKISSEGQNGMIQFFPPSVSENRQLKQTRKSLNYLSSPLENHFKYFLHPIIN